MIFNEGLFVVVLMGWIEEAARLAYFKLDANNEVGSY